MKTRRTGANNARPVASQAMPLPSQTPRQTPRHEMSKSKNVYMAHDKGGEYDEAERFSRPKEAFTV